MIDIAKGRFWDLPLSWVDGCTPCSPGCDHCWSAAMEHRFHKNAWGPGKRSGRLTRRDNGRFNGLIVTHPERLSIPLKRRKPTVWAVWNDWVHESVPFEFIEQMIGSILRCPQHTFLLLTKRPQRILDLYAHWEKIYPPFKMGSERNYKTENAYLGLTVCNQQEADEKIPIFLQVPGKKFLSIEPLLGPVDLRDEHFQFGGTDPFWRLRHINAVILGGETGPGARPLHPDWVRSVRDQCAAAGADFFFKGWGDDFFKIRKVSKKNYGSVRTLDGRTHDELPWKETP